MPPHRIRRAGTVVLRDDFNNGIDRNNWNYEVSMYGGYVSIVPTYSKIRENEKLCLFSFVQYRLYNYNTTL